MDPCGDAAQGAGIGSLATALTWTRAPLAAIGMLAAVVGGSTGKENGSKWAPPVLLQAETLLLKSEQC